MIPSVDFQDLIFKYHHETTANAGGTDKRATDAGAAAIAYGFGHCPQFEVPLMFAGVVQNASAPWLQLKLPVMLEV